MLRDHSLKVYMLKAMIDGAEMSFVEIRDYFELTDGNAYPSIQALLRDCYIEKVPTTLNITVYRITEEGKRAFNDYVKRLLE